MSASEKMPSEPDEVELGRSTTLPQQLGDFTILRRLGRGGMAEVYLAEQVSLGRQVALKTLRPDLVTDGNYLKRFKHEANAAGGLNHPNIVQVYLVGEVDGIHFIAQEFVQGQTLKEYISRKGPLELSLALLIMRQVMTALQIAGDKGIVHRDIKPENILLTKKGVAKVADFGLAQLTQGGERVALTQVGVTVGTPLYMSPEQVKGQPLDARSDLYSFGVMCYHMLAGRAPFQASAAVAVAVKHLHEEAEPLNRIRPDLPVDACNFIHRLMSKKRETRPKDAAEALNEIRRLLKVYGKGGDAAATVVANSTVQLAARSDEDRRAFTVRYALGCLLALACGGLGAWASLPPNPFAQPAPQSTLVPELPNAKAQYFHAMALENNEDAWLAVINRFDGEVTANLAVREARKRLAILYLKSNRTAKAKETFEEIFRRGQLNSDMEQQSLGAAGLAIVARLENDRNEAQNRLKQFKDFGKPVSHDMARSLEDVRNWVDRGR